MFRTEDDIIRVDVVSHISHAIFPACDASVVPAFADPIEMRALMFNLFNAPTDKHVVLILPRYRRQVALRGLENISQIKDWEYLDSVQITYEKTVQSNAASFVRTSETGYLFYKGDFPQLDKTQWFNSEYSNATTTWSVSPQPEEPLRTTSYLRFSWEILLLLVTMSQPLHYGRFVYGLDPRDENIVQFAVYHQIPLQLYAENVEIASTIINNYEETKQRLNPRAIQARRRRKILSRGELNEVDYRRD